MNQKWDGSERRRLLRTEAEAMVVSMSPSEKTAQPTDMLMHELLVHKIELEMQNEQLRNAHLKLEEARDRYIDLYEFAPVAYITVNQDGLISQTNLTGCALLGIERAQLIRRRFSQFVDNQDRDRWYRLFLTMMKQPKGQKQEIDLRMNHADGTLFYARADCLLRESDNALPLLRIALTDISQQKAANEQIEQLAFFDPLTHLPNRQLFKDRLHKALASSTRNKQYGALLFIDLDNFKMLNDSLGHNKGDMLLQQVARRLLSNVRENDTAARLGGDEFVVMLEDLGTCPEDAAIHVKAAGLKILAALNEPYLLEGYDYRCSSSMGATLFVDHLVEEDELLRHVDIAMYQAKVNGRNSLCFFDEKMQAVVTERAALEADLRVALAQNQLQLYFQQQTSLDGQVFGAEALLRWQHPERGLILPMEFIPLAEETGLIVPIGLWVLETACVLLKAWENNAQMHPFKLAVNVSANQFRQAEFVEKVEAVLVKTAIRPNRLTLELTENVMLKDIGDSVTKMLALKKLGVSLSVDDFGTGYSSLSYLTQLPLDQLKIDKSFVRNIGVTHSDALIVQTIIGMANNLGIEVIAEGVETTEQRNFLEQQGCRLGQGYLFGMPVPLEKFEAHLSKAD
ncbi:bifunctional diguanylate cyclase/phosphodiesterase [Methylicorpusculum sp.]|uniref:putative bifunctional diguanylate cyclase/phosphodiesterase n=1 Tax=Methylicorpusculum sp. TaxID=2713644 RepID=UPI0027172A58|nr:GGDEF and EAL domain-containing protein [Methylicorpusculum sp.]MDO8846358.1 EAL domain-containing protein [Methylicorpusculum sp.]